MKRVIIIGASSGIGRALAEYYASKGCKVAVAARREENLKEIQSLYPQNIIYRAMDVADNGSSQIFASMIEALGGLDLLIYCSGSGRYSQELSKEIELETVKVNIKGFLNIIVPAFNYFVSRQGLSEDLPQVRDSIAPDSANAGVEHIPHIVTISSVASVRGLGVSPSYSATKRFQTIYFEALAQKASIKGTKIDFTAIKPGFIATDFINRKYPCTMQLPYAVKRIIRAIEKRKKDTVVDWRWSIAVFLMKLIPTGIWRRMRIG